MLPCRHIHRPVPRDRGDRNCVEYIPMTLHGRIYSLATNVLQTGRRALYIIISKLIIKSTHFYKRNLNKTSFSFAKYLENTWMSDITGIPIIMIFWIIHLTSHRFSIMIFIAFFFFMSTWVALKPTSCLKESSDQNAWMVIK